MLLNNSIKYSNLNSSHLLKYLNENFIFLKKKKNYLFKPYISLKFYKYFQSFSSFFFSYLNAIKKTDYSYHLEIKSIIYNSTFLFNYSFLNNWLLTFFNYTFCIKLKTSSNKKFKNLIQKKIQLLKHTKRSFFFLKILKFYFYLLKFKSFYKFYNFIMLDTFLNFKKSYVYVNKINLYKKLINN